LSVLLCLAASQAGAQVPHLLGYQGRLLRSDGTAATGTASVTFAVFATDPGGSSLWNETQTLGLSDGYYATFLGLVAPPPDGLFDGAARWLEVRVGSETLVPRQQIGSVAYAATAQNVSGGSASVTSLKVAGQTVVDAAGRLAGQAKYTAGPGVSIDDATQTVSLQICAAGQVLVRDASSWQCAAANPGTVTSVSASGPLTVAHATSTPLISLPQAGAGFSGYLSSVDWAAFADKYGAATQCGGDLAGPLSAPTVARLQSRPVASTAPAAGHVLKWTGALWEPAADDDSGGTVTFVSVVPPLTAWNGSSTPQISLAPASGSSDGYLASGDWTRFNTKSDATTQCGGDLAGALAAPQVARLQGVSIATTAPAGAQVLRFDGSAWAPASLGIADVGGLSSGYLDLTGTQTISGAKSFSSAPSFGDALGVDSGGTGTTAAGANTIFAGPAGGDAASPAFRAIDAADVPGLDAAKIASGTLEVGRGGTGASTLSGVLHGNGTGAITGGNVDLAGEVSGTLPLANGGTGTTTGSIAAPGALTFASGAGQNVVLSPDSGGAVILNGSAGVGVSSPEGALEVFSSTGSANTAGTLLLSDVHSAGKGNLRIGIDTSTDTAFLQAHRWATGYGTLSLNPNGGNVGIGTTSPGYRLDVAGDMNTSGNLYFGAGPFYAQREAASAFSTAGAGWYRVAYLEGGSGSAGRGQNTVTVWTGGGDWAPRSTTIRWWHDWSSSAGLSVQSESGDGSLWTRARVTDDGPAGSHAYLEVDFTRAVSGSLSVQYEGGQTNGGVYGDSLTAGSGTARASTVLGHLSVGSGMMVVDTSGKVGIGTTAPAGTLDVRGSVVLENGGNPSLFIGTGTADLNRYLLLLNSPDAQSASGLKAGGILVADTYSWGSPGKNDLLVRGSVGIGAPSPTFPLVVARANATASNGGDIYQNSSAPLLQFRNTDATANNILGGLEFEGTGWYGGAVYMKGVSHSTPQSEMRFSTRNGSDFDDRMTIRPDGSVGIGTTTPSSRLQVGELNVGNDWIDALQNWRISAVQADGALNNASGDGGDISYTWDSAGAVRVDASIGSHRFRSGYVYLPAGKYILLMEYRPTATAHGWTMAGSCANSHGFRLVNSTSSSYTVADASSWHVQGDQVNKSNQYSIVYKSAPYSLAAGTYAVWQYTNPYTNGGYKYWILRERIYRVE